MTEEYDVIIKDASIIDGSGKKAYKGSIAVKDDKIATLGEVKGDAVKTVDARGLYASPGWIDAHSHGDTTLLFFPKAESYIMQGVTTFIGGQCGGSQGPYGDYMGLPGIAAQYIDELEPHKYYPKQNLFPREDVNAIMKKYYGWTVDWETLGEWFKKVEEIGVSMNAAPLVGHGSIRYKVNLLHSAARFTGSMIATAFFTSSTRYGSCACAANGAWVQNSRWPSGLEFPVLMTIASL